MRIRRSRPTIRLIVAAVVSGLLALVSAATALADHGQGPWP